MILNFDHRTINNALFLMATLSPKVRQTIEIEEYRVKADSDGSDAQFILNKCFGDLIRDLEEIGITFSLDYSDFTDDMNKLLEFLHVSSYLLPNTLYDMLKSNHDIKETMRHILDGSLGSDETTIQIYLSELGGLDNQIALVPELTPMLDQLYPTINQTETFTEYLKNLASLAGDEKLVVDHDPEDHAVYRERLRDVVGRLSDAVALFETSPDFDGMIAIQDRIIKDLIAPANFIDYAYLFGNNLETLPEDLLESYERRWYHHRVSHKWCLDYHLVRKTTPTNSEYPMFYAMLYALLPSKVSYIAEAKKILTIYPGDDAYNRILALYQD